MPACQTISVVISPNGLNAPPAFAATTTLTHPMTTKRRFRPPTAMTTVAISKAVVRLSATGDRMKDSTPVAQKSFLSDMRWRNNHARNVSKIPRSSMVLMYVIAASRNRKSSTNSSRPC